MNIMTNQGETGYKSPVCISLELSTEGVLCESNGAGAGLLDDNSWNLTFGE